MDFAYASLLWVLHFLAVSPKTRGLGGFVSDCVFSVMDHHLVQSISLPCAQCFWGQVPSYPVFVMNGDWMFDIKTKFHNSMAIIYSARTVCDGQSVAFFHESTLDVFYKQC